MARATRTGGREATSAVIPGEYGLSVGKPSIELASGFEWRPLSDLARLESGHTPSRRVPEYWDGEIPWIGIRDATANHGRVIDDTAQHVTQLGIENSSARVLPAETVCLSRTASVGYVVAMGQPMATSQDFVNWVCGPELDARYLRYLLVSEQQSIRRFAYGSVHPTLYYPDAKALHVGIPALSEQRAIADVLGVLDDKIEANRKLAATADDLARALLRRAVHDSSRGVEVGSIATFHNKLRVPLSSRERSEMRGDVPYYGANGQIDSVNTHIFDGEYVLVGEDGTVQADDGTPVLSYIMGRAWVSNHAHVLTGEGISTSMLYCLLKTARVDHAVTGAVQPKLSMRNLKGVRVKVPDDISKASDSISPLIVLQLRVQSESRTLATIRDAVLPKLMSGQLRVREAERLVSNAV